MRSKIIYLLISTVLLVSCMKHDLNTTTPYDKVEKNVEIVFGTTFDKEHDWCITTSKEITVTNISSEAEKVQVLAYVNDNDTTTSLRVLNEAKVNGNETITLTCDVPNSNNGLFAFDGKNYSIVNENRAIMPSINNARLSNRRASVDNDQLVITNEVESFASIRKWISGEKLYSMSDESYISEAKQVDDYDDSYKTLFRNVIFSYFKNGRQYNNLPLIKESGYFNEKVYPITTGGEPIIVSPVYKCDKATRYGNEVYNSDLYYYYFKESDLESYVKNGGNEVDFLTNLTKYKAIEFKNHFGETEDDVISKRTSYTLIYWGDGKPTLNETKGTYDFPKGYKIGFMVRAKTTTDGGKKQGELYGDGRLNNKINSYGNFKSSNLGTNGPRMGWINLNGKMLLCCESGTDSDFNDLIVEVEGGVEEIPFIPEFENESYTFCFEDREIGDYDMNDVVIKAKRVAEDTVEYEIVACGALDKLYIKNINGKIINENTEVHALFGKGLEFINTNQNADKVNTVIEKIKVNKDFSFLNESTQPYIFNATTNKNVYLAKKGEDPHGIMIPYDFKYPIELVCIKNAYEKFNEWGQNRITSTNWYKYYVDAFVYQK